MCDASPKAKAKPARLGSAGHKVVVDTIRDQRKQVQGQLKDLRKELKKEPLGHVPHAPHNNTRTTQCSVQLEFVCGER